MMSAELLLLAVLVAVLLLLLLLLLLSGILCKTNYKTRETHTQKSEFVKAKELS